MKHKPVYMDLAVLDEDKRIAIIGKAAMDGQKVGFVVEDDNKADRYIKKLLDKFPEIEVTARGDGPVKGTVWVQMAKAVKH